MMIELLDKLRGRTRIVEPLPQITTARAPEYTDLLARLTNLCVVAGLKQMLEKSYFDICAVDTLCAAAKVRIDGEVYRSLRCVHCMNWNDMPAELRREIYRILGEVFGGTP